ncbi:hypothetical protein SDJN02_27994, partial [Cucurbita argyrosperma subsp. argyrosperma]
MACLDMYNSDHKSLHHRAPASPRISFSSDFVDIQQSLKRQEQRSCAAPGPVSSSDFEFSVSNYSMMTADELFFVWTPLHHCRAPPTGAATTS